MPEVCTDGHRGYNGVYHNWSMKHLTRHINEFSFRLNGGSFRANTIDCIIAVLKSAAAKRLIFAELTAEGGSNA